MRNVVADSADSVVQHQSFFSSPSGVVILSVVTLLTGSFFLYLFRSFPELVKNVTKVVGLLEGNPEAGEKGLVERLRTIEGNVSEQKSRLDNHLEISGRDLDQVRADISEIRRSIENRRTSV